MKYNGNAGIPFPTKQRNEPSSWDKEGKPGLLLSCGGTLVVPSSGDGYVGEILEVPQGCQGPFRGLREKWDFSRDASKEKGLITL